LGRLVFAKDSSQIAYATVIAPHDFFARQNTFQCYERVISIDAEVFPFGFFATDHLRFMKSDFSPRKNATREQVSLLKGQTIVVRHESDRRIARVAMA
jgi:hypothetical protein